MNHLPTTESIARELRRCSENLAEAQPGSSDAIGAMLGVLDWTAEAYLRGVQHHEGNRSEHN